MFYRILYVYIQIKEREKIDCDRIICTYTHVINSDLNYSNAHQRKGG
jgi:hypothetical protein